MNITHEASSDQTPSFVVKKSGIFNLFKDDCLLVQVQMSDHGKLETDMSRSYFGAYYVRHFDRDDEL